MTARSMALISLKWPLYSAIGVRAPSTMTMSFILTPLEIQNSECKIGKRSFCLLHSAFCIRPRQEKNCYNLDTERDHASLYTKRPAREQRASVTDCSQECLRRNVAADVVAEDRA